jgi:hypothetical protein
MNQTNKTMKIRFNIFALLAITATMLAFVPAAHAQKAGLYWSMLTGGTNSVPANSTNFYYSLTGFTDTNSGVTYGPPQIFSVYEYTNVGVTITATPATALNGTVLFKWRLSYDGAQVFEDNPSITVPVTFSGTNRAVGCGSVYVGAATHFELYDAENTNGVAISGVAISYNLKSPKWGAKQVTY